MWYRENPKQKKDNANLCPFIAELLWGKVWIWGKLSVRKGLWWSEKVFWVLWYAVSLQINTINISTIVIILPELQYIFKSVFSPESRRETETERLRNKLEEIFLRNKLTNMKVCDLPNNEASFDLILVDRR